LVYQNLTQRRKDQSSAPTGTETFSTPSTAIRDLTIMRFIPSVLQLPVSFQPIGDSAC
jgi:hypothetical protein